MQEVKILPVIEMQNDRGCHLLRPVFADERRLLEGDQPRMPLRKGEEDRRPERVRRLRKDARRVQREKIGRNNTVAPCLCRIKHGFSIDQHNDSSFSENTLISCLSYFRGVHLSIVLFTSGYYFVERTRNRLRNASAFEVAYWMICPSRSVVNMRVTKIGACSSTSR